MASAPQIFGGLFGDKQSDILAAIGTALLQVKNARGLTLPDMAYALGRSEDMVAKYIAGDHEMGCIAWNRALAAWPEIAERITETTTERRLRAAQRALDLNTPSKPRDIAA